MKQRWLMCISLFTFSAAVQAQENPFLPLQILAETTSPSTGNRYMLTSVTRWVDAYDFAEAQGGWLWVVNDADEMNFVIDAFLPAIDQYADTFVAPPGFAATPDLDLYIGLTDNEEYGGTESDSSGWVWVTGEPVEFTNWSGGEPNNVGPGGEDWAEIWNLRGNRTWNDERDTESGLDDEFPASDPARLPGAGNLSVIELPPIPPPLNLEIDPATGFARLISVTDVPIELRSYSLNSAGGELDSSSWSATNLSAQGVDAIDPSAPGDHWEVVSASAEQLFESFLFGGSMIGVGDDLLLGQVMQPLSDGQPEPELSFEFASKNTNPDIDSSVVTLDVPIAFQAFTIEFSADFDGDGAVDGEDLALWEDGYGATSGATKNDGDADGDGTVSGSDFLDWQRQYGRGVPAVAAVDAVPEPGWLGLALIAAVGAGAIRRRQFGPASR